MQRRQRKPKKKCQKTEYLIGPIEFDILEREDGARVVLLGDRHDYEDQCPKDAECRMTIVQYLDNFFQNYNYPEPLDFFLEVDVPEARPEYLSDQKFIMKSRQWMHEGQIEDNFLVSLWIYFQNCLQKLKTKCEYHRKKQIRFHFSDVRSGVIHSKTRSEHAVFIKDLQDLRNRTSDFSAKHFAILRKLVTRFLSATDDDVNFFFHISKIDKQLGAIAKTNPNLHQELGMVMFRHMKQEEKRATRFLEEVTLGEESLRFPELKKQVDTLGSNLAHMIPAMLLTPLFDIYTLARIIRHDMKQVIIYAGANHTKRIKQFLMLFMGYESLVSRQSKDQCIDLRGIFQPWF
jgi:hypothetical protein